MPSWNPSKEFRLSFGYVSVTDIENLSEYNFKNTDYARLIRYQTCMEDVINVHKGQENDLSTWFGIKGLHDLIVNTAIKNRATKCLNLINKYIDRKLTQYDHNLPIVEIVGGDRRRHDGDIIKGDFILAGSGARESEQLFHYNFVDKVPIYKKRATDALRVFEQGYNAFPHSQDLADNRSYWQNLPHTLDVWVGNHMYHGGVSPIHS